MEYLGLEAAQRDFECAPNECAGEDVCLLAVQTTGQDYFLEKMYGLCNLDGYVPVDRALLGASQLIVRGLAEPSASLA